MQQQQQQQQQLQATVPKIVPLARLDKFIPTVNPISVPVSVSSGNDLVGRDHDLVEKATDGIKIDTKGTIPFDTPSLESFKTPLPSLPPVKPTITNYLCQPVPIIQATPILVSQSDPPPISVRKGPVMPRAVQLRVPAMPHNSAFPTMDTFRALCVKIDRVPVTMA